MFSFVAESREERAKSSHRAVAWSVFGLMLLFKGDWREEVIKHIS